MTHVIPSYVDKTFGKCPRCGCEIASLDSYTGALVDDSGEANSPVKLERFRGKFYCARCINRMEREENTKRKTQRTNRDLQYLEQIGFKKEI